MEVTCSREEWPEVQPFVVAFCNRFQFARHGDKCENCWALKTTYQECDEYEDVHRVRLIGDCR